MLKINIRKCPDVISRGIQSLEFYHISIGRNLKNSIIIDDKKLEKEHLVFRCNKNGLVATSSYSFYLNTKKIKGSTQVKLNDVILIGDTEIVILDFNSNYVTETSDYYDFLEKIQNEKPEIYKIITVLEEEFANQTTKYLDELEK